MDRFDHYETEEAMNKKTLIKIEEQFPILGTLDLETIQELVRENLDTMQLSPWLYPRVKIPTSGGQRWVVPSLETGEEDTVKTLVGIIVHHSTGREFYEKAFEESGGKEPPLCYSPDGLMGYGHPGGVCKSCPMNEWGTHPRGGTGKACRERRRIFLLQPGEILPMLISIPPTSIVSFDRYRFGLTKKLRSIYGVVTELSLEKSLNKSGIEYAAVVFRMLQELTPQQKARVKEYASAIQAIFTVPPAGPVESESSPDSDEGKSD